MAITGQPPSMQAGEFYGLVQEAGHLDTIDRARTATAAVLETLGETLTGGELRDLKAQFADALDPLFEGVTIDRENG